MTKYDPDVKHHVNWKAFFCIYNSCENSADTIDVGKILRSKQRVSPDVSIVMEMRSKKKSTLLQLLSYLTHNIAIRTLAGTLNVGAELDLKLTGTRLAALRIQK